MMDQYITLEKIILIIFIAILFVGFEMIDRGTRR